ncbi:uncharacterized protein LOC119786943 [Cyprinodon tularosa]|uniref:uncharacterized protein LOC119786943 n=1 Tax=Cyprinodon tularosa TaxID=77115 RepID=UPI0018E27755|nr:uncharacterized protein LOC119786943 [Cyprinodon tularosa]
MEDIEKGTVRNLVATFLDKEHTGKSAGFKEKDKKLRTSKSCECLSERAQRSTELPLKGKRSEIPDFDNETQSHWSKHIPFPNKMDSRQKKLVSEAIGSLTAKYELSKKHPAAFKGARSGKPDLDYSLDGTQSDSSKDIPVNFSSKKSGKPDLDYSLDETQSDCSKDIPVNFSNKKDSRQKKLVSEAIGSLTAKYELSKKHPTAFKRGRSGKPDLVYSLDETQSDCSKDIPVNFSNKKDFRQKELVSEAIGSLRAKYELSNEHHVTFKEARSGRPDLVYSLDETQSDCSKDIPVNFSNKKDFRQKELVSEDIGSLRAKYEHSNEHHVTFKEARSGRPGLVYSLGETQSDCSKDIPVNFSNKKDFRQKELVLEAIGSLRAKYEHSNEHHVTFKEARSVKPDVDYSQYETESELSRENPLYFSNKIEISRGIPKHWGKSGIVSHNTDPSRFQVPNLPSAVYHQKTANIAHHDTTFQSPKLDYPEIVESISSSETSEYSSLISKDSYDGKDGVICDLCQENAAVRICLTCNDLFCEPDALQHTVAKICKNTF